IAVPLLDAKAHEEAFSIPFAVERTDGFEKSEIETKGPKALRYGGGHGSPCDSRASLYRPHGFGTSTEALSVHECCRRFRSTGQRPASIFCSTRLGTIGAGRNVSESG